MMIFQIERGVRLYGQNEQRLAVKVWLSALRGVRHRSDKFALLGHLYQAYMDFGKYRYVSDGRVNIVVIKYRF